MEYGFRYGLIVFTSKTDPTDAQVLRSRCLGCESRLSRCSLCQAKVVALWPVGWPTLAADALLDAGSALAALIWALRKQEAGSCESGEDPDTR